MNKLQVDYFLSVANTQNLTRSAQELFVTPPAISKQIALAEKELGVRLFTRLGRGMELTAAGQLMYEHFSSQKASFEIAIKNAHAAESMQSKVLTLGVIMQWSIYEPLRRFSEFLLMPPYESVLSVIECELDSIGNSLESGEVDAILCLGGEFSTLDRPEDITTMPIAKIRRVLLFSANNPLARKENLIPADFAGMLLLLPTSAKHPAAQNHNQFLCTSHGFLPRIVPMKNFGSMLLKVGMDDGFTLLDEWADKLHHPAFAHLMFDETHTVSLVWLTANQNPAIKALSRCAEIFSDWQSSQGQSTL